MVENLTKPDTFAAWEASRIPNPAYPWAKAAWDAQQDLIEAQIAEIRRLDRVINTAAWMLSGTGVYVHRTKEECLLLILKAANSSTAL